MSAGGYGILTHGIGRRTFAGNRNADRPLPELTGEEYNGIVEDAVAEGNRQAEAEENDVAESPIVREDNGTDSLTINGLGAKKDKYIAKRGWTLELINTVYNSSYTTRAAINKANGNPATAFYNQAGDYIVIDDITGQLIQASKYGEDWIPDSTIQNPYLPNQNDIGSVGHDFN